MKRRSRRHSIKQIILLKQYYCEEELEPKIRKNKKRIIGYYDDIPQKYIRSWKYQRKTKHQYKNKDFY